MRGEQPLTDSPRPRASSPKKLGKLGASIVPYQEGTAMTEKKEGGGDRRERAYHVASSLAMFSLKLVIGILSTIAAQWRGFEMGRDGRLYTRRHCEMARELETTRYCGEEIKSA